MPDRWTFRRKALMACSMPPFSERVTSIIMYLRVRSSHLPRTQKGPARTPAPRGVVGAPRPDGRRSRRGKLTARPETDNRECHPSRCEATGATPRQ
jgi:hypothetical protein